MGGATAAEEETRQASQRKLWNPARRCFPRHVLGWANCCASSSFVLSFSSKVNSQQEHRTFTHWPTGDWVPWTTDMMEEDGPTYYALKHFNENFAFSALSLRNFASRSPESVADHTIVARLILEPRTAISFRQRSTAGDLCIFKGNIEFQRRVAKTTRRLHRSSRREALHHCSREIVSDCCVPTCSSRDSCRNCSIVVLLCLSFSNGECNCICVAEHIQYNPGQI